MFKLTIKTDNAAFEDDEGAECARILRNIAERLDRGEKCGLCVDVNGNHVGEWSL